MASHSTMLLRNAMASAVLALAVVTAAPLRAQSPAVELDAAQPVGDRLLVAPDRTFRHAAAHEPGEVARMPRPEIEAFEASDRAVRESLTDAITIASQPYLDPPL